MTPLNYVIVYALLCVSAAAAVVIAAILAVGVLLLLGARPDRPVPHRGVDLGDVLAGRVAVRRDEALAAYEAEVTDLNSLADQVTRGGDR